MMLNVGQSSHAKSFEEGDVHVSRRLLPSSGGRENTLTFLFVMES